MGLGEAKVVGTSEPGTPGLLLSVSGLTGRRMNCGSLKPPPSPRPRPPPTASYRPAMRDK